MMELDDIKLNDSVRKDNDIKWSLYYMGLEAVQKGSRNIPNAIQWGN